MKAVILAAGMGSRIREQHDKPKGFIRLGDKTIIETSIQKLQQYGIQDILLVTGYADHYYVDLAAKLDGISLIHNQSYDRSGSLYSLYCARDWIDDDFLLLDSDIIYHQQALEKILHCPHENSVLVSGKTNSGDEVYIEAENDQLINMSKQLATLSIENVLGEFVGITKLSLKAYQRVVQRLENKLELLSSGHYEEDGLVELSKMVSIFCLKINDLIWCEIDDAQHLLRAHHIHEKLNA